MSMGPRRNMVHIEIDQVSMGRLRTYLDGKPQEINKVIASAVNDTGRQMRSRISRGIRQQINLKAKEVTPYIKFKRASRSRPAGRITISESRRIPLSRFAARQTRQGVTYKIAKRGGRRLVPGAFLAAVQGGSIAAMGGDAGVGLDNKEARGVHYGAFVRLTRKRYPIHSLRGISPWGAFVRTKGLQQKTETDTRELLATNINRRLRFVLLKEAGAI